MTTYLIETMTQQHELCATGGVVNKDVTKVEVTMTTYLIEAMIQQHQLSATRGAVDKDVTRVRVAVHVTLHKDHLAVKFPQPPGHLHRSHPIHSHCNC